MCVSMSECKRVCEHGCVCDGERERERMKKSSQVFSTQASKQKKNPSMLSGLFSL